MLNLMEKLLLIEGAVCSATVLADTISAYLVQVRGWGNVFGKWNPKLVLVGRSLLPAVIVALNFIPDARGTWWIPLASMIGLAGGLVVSIDGIFGRMHFFKTGGK